MPAKYFIVFMLTWLVFTSGTLAPAGSWEFDLSAKVWITKNKSKLKDKELEILRLYAQKLCSRAGRSR
ncbi:hypothetical protein B0A65_13995 [Flavobacterium frigidimaris]|uniref:Uncharacterized protein n=1 Tax=Flavobacterium frigidimaris TaxID=262320 RepID=A0ABX4BP58_FLAFR|nr:hypothetical protein B0A65_13995 [Flavobacterium frigidimaris]